MQTISEIQDEIIEEFTFLENKNDRYNYIIELGKKPEALSEEEKDEKFIVKGCQSKVWLVPALDNSRVVFKADSESVLVKGLVSLLVRVLSGHSPKEVAEADLYFIDKIGMQQMLTMNRANGLASMIKQMKMYALAYQAIS